MDILSLVILNTLVILSVSEESRPTADVPPFK